MSTLIILCAAPAFALLDVLNFHFNAFKLAMIIAVLCSILIFYVLSIIILDNSEYTKSLFHQIDEKKQKRGTYILRSYLWVFGRWIVASIILFVLFMFFSSETNDGLLIIKIFGEFTNFLNAFLFSIFLVNFFYLLLLIHTILTSLIFEARVFRLG